MYFVLCSFIFNLLSCFIFTFLSIYSFICYLEVLRSVAKMTIKQGALGTLYWPCFILSFSYIVSLLLVFVAEYFSSCLSSQRFACFHSFTVCCRSSIKSLERLWHGKVLYIFKTHISLWPWLNLHFRWIFSAFKWNVIVSSILHITHV